MIFFVPLKNKIFILLIFYFTNPRHFGIFFIRNVEQRKGRENLF